MESRIVAESCAVGGVLHQLEYVRCGKPRCRCNVGVLHGPYWYSYHWIKRRKRRRRKSGKSDEPAGRWISRYVGKELGADPD